MRGRADNARTVHLTNMLGIGDVHIPFAIYRHVVNKPQLGALSRSSVARIGRAATSDSGNRAYGSTGVHFADARVAVIGDVHISRAIERHTGRGVEARTGGRSAVARKCPDPGGGSAAGHGRDVSIAIHLTD